MKISKNFELREFTESSTAKLKGIANNLGINEVKAIENLVTKLLQPLRELYNKPMRINSGYRCPELNKAVGGVPTSQHVKGEAADIRTDNPRELFNLVRNSGLSFDQLILYPTFVHISFRSKDTNRNQVLYAKGVQP